jgi:hypothetical protein
MSAGAKANPSIAADCDANRIAFVLSQLLQHAELRAFFYVHVPNDVDFVTIASRTRLNTACFDVQLNALCCCGQSPMSSSSPQAAHDSNGPELLSKGTV